MRLDKIIDSLRPQRTTPHIEATIECLTILRKLRRVDALTAATGIALAVTRAYTTPARFVENFALCCGFDLIAEVALRMLVPGPPEEMN